MNKHTFKFLLGIIFTSMLSACGGGGDSNTAAPTPTSITVSGTISFDKVRQTSTSNPALNYNVINSLPAAGIVVEALDSIESVIANTTTDENGRYTFSLTPNIDVKIRAKAQLLDNRWNFKVTDNTNGDALYVLDGQTETTGITNSTRDLHADSGWGGAAYTNTRAAAPFALLEVVFSGIQQIVAVDNSTSFPAAEIRWSINNRPSSGNLIDGDINTSFFTITNGLPTIYILGAEDVDTDEYDEDVVAHEWGHYLESQLSRSDSIGGAHGIGDFLDMRVAFSEGLGNALSGIINGDSFYVDSFGPSQANGFTLDLETKSNFSPTGWFSEGAIQSLLFDIADTNSDGQDTLALGMAGISRILTDNSYKQSSGLNSIFTFAEAFKALDPANAVGLDNLLTANGINSDSGFAIGETNNASRNNILPIYTDITAGGSSINLCSTNLDGEQNKLSTFRFAKFEVITEQQYTITAVRTSGAVTTDPDFVVLDRGQILLRADSPPSNQETGSVTLALGTYVISLVDFFNIDDDNTTGGVSCFDLSVI